MKEVVEILQKRDLETVHQAALLVRAADFSSKFKKKNQYRCVLGTKGLLVDFEHEYRQEILSQIKQIIVEMSEANPINIICSSGKLNDLRDYAAMFQDDEDGKIDVGSIDFLGCYSKKGLSEEVLAVVVNHIKIFARSVNKLELADNFINTVQSLLALEKLLKELNVKVLDISCNEITDVEAWRTLGRIVQENGITELNIAENIFSEPGSLAAFMDELQGATELRRIDFGSIIGIGQVGELSKLPFSVQRIKLHRGSEDDDLVDLEPMIDALAVQGKDCRGKPVKRYIEYLNLNHNIIEGEKLETSLATLKGVDVDTLCLFSCGVVTYPDNNRVKKVMDGLAGTSVRVLEIYDEGMFVIGDAITASLRAIDDGLMGTDITIIKFSNIEVVRRYGIFYFDSCLDLESWKRQYLAESLEEARSILRSIGQKLEHNYRKRELKGQEGLQSTLTKQIVNNISSYTEEQILLLPTIILQKIVEESVQRNLERGEEQRAASSSASSSSVAQGSSLSNASSSSAGLKASAGFVLRELQERERLQEEQQKPAGRN